MGPVGWEERRSCVRTAEAMQVACGSSRNGDGRATTSSGSSSQLYRHNAAGSTTKPPPRTLVGLDRRHALQLDVASALPVVVA